MAHHRCVRDSGARSFPAAPVRDGGDLRLGDEGRRAREEPEALADLYLRYRDRLYAWFRVRAGEAAAAELTAELFAQVALSLRRFRDEANGSAAPWLYGIAKNLVRRHHERRRRQRGATAARHAASLV